MQPMRVRALEPGADLGQLLSLWNRSVVPMLPQCHEITGTQLAHELELVAAPEPSSAPAAERALEHRAILVAEATAVSEGGPQLLGFVDCGVDPAHVGSGRQSLGSPPLNLPQRGMIRWLWFLPGSRAAGEALVDAADAHLRQHGCHGKQLLAFDDSETYHFYHIGHAFLSDRANHIHSVSIHVHTSNPPLLVSVRSLLRD